MSGGRSSVRAVVLVFALTLATTSLDAGTSEQAVVQKPATSVAPTAPVAPKATAKKKAAKPKAKAAAKKTGEKPPAPDPDLEWQKARALADQGKYEEALAVIEAAIRQFPGNTGLLWQRAGVTGESGNHKEAVALYERLMADHPETAREIRSDLATQRLWAGDPHGAVRDFERRMQEATADREARKMHALALAHADRLPESLASYERLLAETPDDVELALDRARVLTWMGRNVRAAEAYAQILEQHPGEPRAELGLAQNENWAGQHGRAALLFEKLLRENPNDVEAQKGLAYAYYWDGRSEQSRTTLSRYLAQHPGDREGLDLARMIERGGDPHVEAEVSRSDDSDALRIRTTRFQYRRPIRNRTALLAGMRRDQVKDAFGNRDPLQIGLGLEKGWSRVWSSTLFLAVLEPEKGEKTDLTGALSVTMKPRPGLRFDAGHVKEPVLTRQSLAAGVMLRTTVVGIDWQPFANSTVSLAQRWRNYSDSNHGTQSSISLATWPVALQRGRVALTFGYDQLRIDEDLDHGYYDPGRYVEFGPGTIIEWSPGGRWDARFAGQIGSQKEQGSDAEEFHKFSAELEIPLGNAFALLLEGGRSNSSLSASSGFKQNHWGATLNTRF